MAGTMGAFMIADDIPKIMMRSFQSHHVAMLRRPLLASLLRSPGAVATELPESSSEEATRKNLREFYKMAIPANSIASAIAYAIEQPAEVEIDEVVIRPTAQDF
jgi:NADP-dependent 3-hydroxy acid dehydrogenase YdfG